MKKIFIIATLVIFLIVILVNYIDIATFIISRLQHKEELMVFYEDDIEPKDRIADISIVALDSMVTSKIGDKKYRFISLDVKVMGKFSDGEVQYLLTYFKKYNDRVICASLTELVRIGLGTPLIKDLRGGVLLAIDDVIEKTNESVVLKVTHYQSGMGAEGYICRLVYKDGKWIVNELELKYMA